ncbi:hypothetical protein CAOG_05726 [Capsaspora owczarzaki ATCC 30864]|uniref:Uncharacterized protein n=1 Tax=Capsaspora owczarzaki (strain ATCC 30864) TaxID=595528 RepID=A0A0D2WU02_CAPO3|nr:hypothetical protein CAOG_05726 [Capsaspora owczarzaki ATCC 30864]KJE95253.1 hypothetical protein CAOG_005726 [Capsaspora owczarzaki ATCC 30864]|eukprot:XP_004346399.2 hypothetical protein CAOG_05726 [Capsaspora owczarzaki ATCC 30864]
MLLSRVALFKASPAAATAASTTAAAAMVSVALSAGASSRAALRGGDAAAAAATSDDANAAPATAAASESGLRLADARAAAKLRRRDALCAVALGPRCCSQRLYGRGELAAQSVKHTLASKEEARIPRAATNDWLVQRHESKAVILKSGRYSFAQDHLRDVAAPTPVPAPFNARDLARSIVQSNRQINLSQLQPAAAAAASGKK